MTTYDKSFRVKNGLVTPPASTTVEPMIIPHGSAPTSPTDGSIWTTAAGVYARINGITVGPLGTGGATGEPVYIQATQPTGTKFMWWDTSTSVPTLWIEDGS